MTHCTVAQVHVDVSPEARGTVWRPDLVIGDPGPGFRIHYAGQEHLDPNRWRVALHAHCHFELLVIERGVQTTSFDPETSPEQLEVTADSDSVLLFAPTLKHAERLEHDCSARKLTLGFSMPNFSGSLPRMIKDPRGRIRELARWIVHDMSRNPEASGRLQHLLVAAVEEYARLADPTDDSLERQVRQLLEQAPGRNFGLNQLAKEVGMCRTSFAQLFRREVGEAPMAFVRRVRLEHARHLIEETDLPLKAIAADVGFASLAHLSTAIRASFGCPPSALRRGSSRPPAPIDLRRKGLV